MKKCLDIFFYEESGMIVEFILAMLLLLGFIVFLTIFGRSFSERSRMLAANRTVAWLYTHADNDSGKKPDDQRGQEKFRNMAQNGELANLLAEWHFRKSGVGAGIVVVGDEFVDKGMFVKRPGGEQFDQTEAIKGIAQQGLTARTDRASADKPANLDNASVAIKGEADSPKLGTMITDMSVMAMEAFGNFLTGDFEHYHAYIGYGMPMIFPRTTLEFFWGPGIVQDLESLNDFDKIRGHGWQSMSGEPQAGRVYAFIRPSFSGGCIMPVLDCGSKGGALQDISIKLDGIMGILEKANDKMNDKLPKYRPFNHPDDAGAVAGYFADPPELNVTAMKALLVFEKDYPDPPEFKKN